MCGISCAVTLRGHGPRNRGANSSRAFYEQERVYLGKSMSDSLEIIKHRGPDDRGYWTSNDCRVCLGHVRLSIIDLSENAQQPFHDQEGDIHAVVSGEFYDHEKVRAELLALNKGYTFQSQCDSEIIIALYKEYGMSFISRLRGEFAFCLYDSKTQYFVAGRDRYGVKPLFYTVHDGRLLIASEMKAFKAFGWQPEWDIQSMLQTGWVSDTRTYFQGVQKILPGHYIAVQSFETIVSQQYWDMEYRDKHQQETRTEEEMIENVREKLLDAVRVRLKADVPVGIFLSGGLDSSTTAGMIKHLMVTEGAQLGSSKSDRINCFSIKFMDDEFDEEPIAQRTAEWLGVKTYVARMTEEKFVECFDDATYHVELPLFDLNYIGKFELSRITREVGIKVILTGEGSDEHFAGYGDLLGDFVREPDYAWPNRDLPEEIRLKKFEELENPPEREMSLKSWRQKDPPSAMMPRSQINNVGFIAFTQFAGWGDYTAPWAREEFGTSDERTTAVHNGINGRTRELIQLKWHPLHSALYIWSKCTLNNVLLTALGDRVEMAHSIEGRQPFLDHNVTEYVNELPPTMKFKWDAETGTFNEKWILKEAAKPFITDELYHRRKHPFSAPVKYKPDGPLRKYMESLLTKENVDNLGFLDWNRCKDLVQDGIVNGDTQRTRKLFVVAGLITLSKRFGVKKAEPEYADFDDTRWDNIGTEQLQLARL